MTKFCHISLSQILVVSVLKSWLLLFSDLGCYCSRILVVIVLGSWLLLFSDLGC